jgi:hypothetical protein
LIVFHVVILADEDTLVDPLTVVGYPVEGKLKVGKRPEGRDVGVGR